MNPGSSTLASITLGGNLEEAVGAAVAALDWLMSQSLPVVEKDEVVSY